MNLAQYISIGRKAGASDLHLEPGLPAALRIQGELQTLDGALTPSPQALVSMARELLTEEEWARLQQRRSFDLARTVSSVRCRINILHSSRGLGFAVRLLAGIQPTLEKLNLLPELKELMDQPHGLVIVSGATGSGKTSTLAGLVDYINGTDNRHIVTIEEPIEYAFHPRRAYIRQREVGRDTTSFFQGLVDAMREDPDVLIVGEMRHPRVMRLTLNAAETGHLVLTTLHSSTCAEALQRIIASFAPEIQSGVSAQLADCLLAVVCQRLPYRPEVKMRVPECEILRGTTAVRSLVRQGNFFKLPSALETGAKDGMWTFQRYRAWLDQRTQWYLPDRALPELPDVEQFTTEETRQREMLAAAAAAAQEASTGQPQSPKAPESVIDLEVSEEKLDDILKQLKKKAS